MRKRMNVNVLGAMFLMLPLVLAAPDSPVADAAMKGDIETVRSLLREGADVNAAQGDGMTALHWAAVRNDVAMARLVLYAGANVASTTRLGGYTPLHLASREGLGDAVGALLEAGSKPNGFTTTGVSAIHLAAQAGRPHAIRALLEHGAEVDARDAYAGRTPLMFATARDRQEAMKILIHAGADVALATDVKDIAAQAEEDGRDRARADRIRRAKLDPEPEERGGARAPASQRAQRGTPGQAAAPPDSTGAKLAVPDSTAAAKTVADSAARARELYPPEPDRPTSPPDPDSAAAAGGNQPRSLSYTDLVGRQGGMTALHYAVRDGRMEAALLLLESGADINQLTEGDRSSPMVVAIINGNFDLAMLLLDMGADPTLSSEDGVQPLFAVINNEWALRTWYPQPTASQQQQTSYLELMKALLDAGVDPNAQLETHVWYAAFNAGRMGVTFAGATAFWRAAYGTDVAAMRLLVEYGADPNIFTVKVPSRRRSQPRPDTTSTGDTTETIEDPSGLAPVPTGGPAVHPLHAASGVGYGTSRVGQQHRHVPDGWLPAVKYLIEELGIDVNVRDHEAYSALHNAAARGDNAVIELLVKHGADVMFVSRRGQTTVDMANGPQQRVQPFPETIALLESLGAENNHNCRSC